MGSIIKGLQVNALLFHTLLEALDKNIIPIATLAIHADRYAMFAQHTCKGLTGELTALISVEDVRFAIACQGLFQYINTKVRLQRVRLMGSISFKAFYPTQETLAGIELSQMLRKGQYLDSGSIAPWEHFYSLAG